MMRKRFLFAAALVILASVVCCRSGKKASPVLQGPYMGQEPPGATPVLFAPGMVSTGLNENSVTFMPDGRECYWSVLFSGFETIVTSRLDKGGWTEPETAPFAGQYYDGWPSIQSDGKRMYFHSARPHPDSASGVTAKFNIWYVDRAEDGWSEPKSIGQPVNGPESSSCPSVTRDGTIYISKKFNDGTEKLCRSRFVDGKYRDLEVLPAVINVLKENFHGFISPDESYMIRPLYGIEDAVGGGWNFYVSFRSADDRWSDWVNLGKGVNSPYCLGINSISPDGKYIFLQAWTPFELTPALERRFSLKELKEKHMEYPSGYSSDIYWVDARIIEELRPKE
jgi:hypothetical protein